MDDSSERGAQSPFFMVGFARSGTTWMNSVLRDHLDIGLVNEGQFIVEFGKKYARSTEIADLDKLLDRMSRDEFFSILKRAYGISINWSAIRHLPKPCTFSAVIRSILGDIANKQGKPAIGSKSPGFGWDMEVLLRHFPDARIVHVIRDGRDCALSHYEMLWGRQNAYVVASKWQDHIQRIRTSVRSHDVAYIEVRYEDILYDPGHEFSRLADFVHKYAPAPSREHSTEELLRRFAATITERDYQNRTHKWKTKMSTRDKLVFESIAGQRLAELGYDVSGERISIPPWRRYAYIAHDRIMREFYNAHTILTKPATKKKAGSR